MSDTYQQLLITTDLNYVEDDDKSVSCTAKINISGFNTRCERTRKKVRLC